MSTNMATAQHLQGPRLPRSASLQKMLDLEKQFKLARDQAKTVPSSPNVDSMIPRTQAQTAPIQTRRRDSRESVSLQSQQHSSIPTSARCSGPAPPLFISIPTPRPATGMTGNSNDDEGDDEGGDDAKSEQSSICQSPSWEGYGQKKKDRKKKQEAEQQRRHKSKTSQDTRPSTRKRATNRLFKAPPTESTDTALGHTRPPSSTFMMPAGGATDTKTGRTTPSGHHSLLPDVWCVAMGSGLSGHMVQPPYSRSASSLGMAGAQGKPEIEARENTTQKVKGKGKSKADSNGTYEKAYPPLSSRSHALRHSLLPVHIRQKSASSLSSSAGLGLTIDDHTRTPKDNYLYATKNLSDQSVDYTAEPAVMRGRQSVDPMSTSTATTTGSYVRQARAQSIERSIKGFMQEAALSDPNLLNAPNRMAFSYIGSRTDKDGVKQNNKQDGNHQPSSSQSKMRFGKDKEQLVEKTTETEQHNSKDNVVDPASSDYFTLASNHYSPANLEPGTPSSGILSSIKSRISRRSSVSSGSTSNTGKSFKERAMGAMHLQSTAAQSTSAVSNNDAASLPSRKSSQTLSQANTSSTVQKTGAETTSTSTSIERTPAPTLPKETRDRDSRGKETREARHKERRLLPKAARVLGETNQQTMLQGASSHSRPSEGSSTSSYHEDSSVPPSPVSTPDTSRPQSTKDSAAAVDNATEAAKMQSTETLSAETSLTEGLGILDEAWSQSTVAPDNDAQSFVTTLTNQKSATSLRSQAGIINLKEAALMADHDLGTHPALKNEDGAKRRHIPQLMTVVNEEPSRDLKNTKESKASKTEVLREAKEPSKVNTRASAVYHQGARRSVPMVSSPLSKVIRSAKASMAAPGNAVDSKVPASPTRYPAYEPEMVQMQLPPAPLAPPKQPIAKMLVECCHCKFFHDMPSRVYECMARPDAVVTDSDLGVSGAITTMVKCPWCAHNMSTSCCAGYAAVVYLKERLH